MSKDFKNKNTDEPGFVGPAEDYHATTISRRRRLRRSVAHTARKAALY